MASQIDLMYEEYFSQQSSSSLFKYEPFCSKNTTLNYLNSTHSRRTTNIYSQTPPLKAMNDNNNDEIISNSRCNSLPTTNNNDIDMNMDDDDDDDIDMMITPKSVKKNDENDGNEMIIKWKVNNNNNSVLGKRSFLNAFQENNDYKQYKNNGYCSNSNHYEITMPFSKKQRI